MKANLYLNLSEFELICLDADGKHTNIGIDLTTGQAKKICEIIGLLGFAEENNEIVGIYKIPD